MPPLRLLFYATSLTGFALLGAVLAGVHVPLGWLLAAFAVHGGLGTLGVFFPVLGVWADAFCRGVPGQRRIALTFDDGPHPATTRRVLAMLAEHGARATFFVLGSKVRKHPELVREIAAAGHGVALHGDEHDHFYTFRSTASVRRDLERAARAVKAAAGLRPTLFRPPIGFVSHAVALGAEACGLRLVGWSLRVLDGHRAATSEGVLRRALTGLADGAVLLLHDASEADDREPASLPVLGELLRAIERAGLEAVRVEELFEAPR
jgi:peptidoglycan-N-acetylglucosamine deacetylase